MAAGALLGLELIGQPLFEIEPVAWDLPGADFDGLLVGSANAFRHGGAKLAVLQDLPVYTVGQATARAAEAAGFRVKKIGEGGLQALTDDLAGRPLRMLRLAGEERVDLDLPDGIAVAERIVYRSAPRDLTGATLAPLRSGGIALLHSARAAEHFAAQYDAAGLARSGLHIAAMAPRIAQGAGLGWASVRIAERVDDSALLAMARDMCNKIAGFGG
jgi:uroporphyrinogen-III synthase